MDTLRTALVEVDHHRIDYATADAFGLQLDGALGDGASTLLIDLSRVDFIASVGLRLLIDVAKKSRAFIGLIAPQPRVREVLEIARLDGLIPIFESPDAVAWRLP